MKHRKISRALSVVFLASILIGVHNGRIALWENDDPQPSKVFPYPVSLLPKEQQKLLENGIRVESMEELHRLLEAYLS